MEQSSLQADWQNSGSKKQLKRTLTSVVTESEIVNHLPELVADAGC